MVDGTQNIVSSPASNMAKEKAAAASASRDEPLGLMVLAQPFLPFLSTPELMPLLPLPPPTLK